MSLFTAQLHPGRALGFLTLGASMHDVLTRLKAEPQTFPKLQVLYSRDEPFSEPVCVALPANGIRLRFDGPEQRLRLIEVTDFTKSHITFKERDLVRPVADGSAPAAASAAGEHPASVSASASAGGPTFRHIYHRLLGPTYAGEFIPPAAGQGQDGGGSGTYVLSYPGVAFNFALPAAAYSADRDVVSLLSASSAQVATSMAVFSGPSWAEARPTLWTEVLPSVKVTATLPRGKDVFPDEVSLVRLHGGGRIQLFRKWTSSCLWLALGETTAQDLVAELGPPNAIYRKNDQRMVIHKLRAGAGAGGKDALRPDELTDTDQSSMNEGSDDSDSDAPAPDDNGEPSPLSGECFYNYFYLGFDVLLSTHTPPSAAPPGSATTTMTTTTTTTTTATTTTTTTATHGPDGASRVTVHDPARLVATKLVLHGNIPGSYEFNRHRRCRWEISYLDDGTHDRGPITSETDFKTIQALMRRKWDGGGGGGADARRHDTGGMVLNRGWGDSPGSSCEFLGGWEESGSKRPEASGDSTTTLFGFPGMVFEVLKNDYVNTLTVF